MNIILCLVMLILFIINVDYTAVILGLDTINLPVGMLALGIIYRLINPDTSNVLLLSAG